jgi:hypothetical protein
MKITIVALLLLINVDAFAKSNCDLKLGEEKYRACLKEELLKENPDVGSKIFDQAQDNKGWVEALGVLSMPLANLGSDHKFPKINSVAWEKAYAEAYDSPENKANRVEFEKVLDEQIKRGGNPLSVSDVSKYTTLVSDYNLLKMALEAKDLPSFEEFKKNPDSYITRSGWEVFPHKKKSNGSKEEKIKSDCEEVSEQYVICNGNKYVRSNETSDSLKRSIKTIEHNLDLKKVDTTSGAIQK